MTRDPVGMPCPDPKAHDAPGDLGEIRERITEALADEFETGDHQGEPWAFSSRALAAAVLDALGLEQVGRMVSLGDETAAEFGCVGMVFDRPSKSPFPRPDEPVYRLKPAQDVDALATNGDSNSYPRAES